MSSMGGEEIALHAIVHRKMYLRSQIPGASRWILGASICQMVSALPAHPRARRLATHARPAAVADPAGASWRSQLLGNRASADAQQNCIQR